MYFLKYPKSGYRHTEDTNFAHRDWALLSGVFSKSCRLPVAIATLYMFARSLNEIELQSSQAESKE
jgi:hypothetical protein